MQPPVRYVEPAAGLSQPVTSTSYQEQRAYSNDVSTNNSRDEYYPRETDSVQNNGGFSDVNADSSRITGPQLMPQSGVSIAASVIRIQKASLKFNEVSLPRIASSMNQRAVVQKIVLLPTRSRC